MKKLLFILALFISITVYSQQGQPQAPIVFNTVEQMMGMRTSYTFAKVTDSLRGGWFNLVPYNGSSTIDSGIVFPSAMPGKVWWRDITNATYIFTTWFGAIPDCNPFTFSGTLNDTYIQRAIDFAAKRPIVSTVYTPRGLYLIDSIFIPQGVIFKGSGGLNEANVYGGTKFFQRQSNHSAITCYAIDSSTNQNLFWYGGLMDFGLQGNINSTYGYGIAFKQRNGITNVALQDMNEIRNITIRNFKSGGFLLPLGGGDPANFFNIKILWCGGPGWDISTTNINVSGSSSFINCSGDGNVGGLFYLRNLSHNQGFTFVNIKSEMRPNNPFTHTYEQQNGIVVDNCDSVVIDINGWHLVSSTPNPSGPSLLNPGDLIKIVGSGTPLVTWEGVSFKVFPQYAKPEPVIVTGTDISWRTYHGFYPNYININRIDSVLPFANKGQTIFANQDFSNKYHAADEVFYGKVVYTDSQLVHAKEQFIDIKDVFNTWGRVAYGGVDSITCSGSQVLSDTPYVASLCTNSWVYDDLTGILKSNSNSGAMIGFVSNKSYKSYYHKAEIGCDASPPSNDNDRIGLIIAQVEDYNDMIYNGAYGKNPSDYDWPINTTDSLIPNQHTLSLLINRDNDTLEYFVYYDYRTMHQKLILNGTSLLSYTPTSNWDGNFIDVAVEKDNDTIRTWCSNFSDAPGGKGGLSHELIIDLNKDPLLKKFAGSVKFGYLAQSQRFAKFDSIFFNSSDNNIYDLRNGDVWIADNSENYSVDPNLNSYTEIGIRKLWRNPNEKTFGWTYADNTYDVIKEPIGILNKTFTNACTWVGTTPPSGDSIKTYSWSRSNNLVTLTLLFTYSVAGSAITECQFMLPNDLPPPALLNNTANAFTTLGYGGFQTSLSNPINAAARIQVQNTGLGYKVRAITSSVAPTVFTCTIQYFTND